MLVCPLCRVALDASETTCPRDGREGVEHTFGAIVDELSARFSIVAPFARGGTGDLFLADDRQTGRRGILKILHNESGVSTTDRQRLKRELVKQATLSHSNLALPAVTGEAGGSIWLFREWVDGVSLRVRLSRGGRLATPEALSIAAQLAGALDELHRAGLLHRDLKPGHILLQPQPSGLSKVVIIDAGVAARIDTADSFDVAGSPGYVSPEQATGKLVSFRSDLYSLGVITYEMLEGRPPYQGEDTASLLRDHAEAPVPTAPADAPSGVQKLIDQLLAKDPRQRPFSAQQSKRVIEPFLPEAKGSREPTVAFEADDAHVKPAEAASSRGSGTLRPPQSKVTIMGMPAAPHEPSKPPPPPADQPVRRSDTLSRPPPPPGTAAAPKAGANGKRVSSVPPPPPAGALKKKTQGADSTQELDALDLEHVEAPVIEASPEGAAPQAPGATTGGRDDLDYDDLAETTAMERGEAVERLGLAATVGTGMAAVSAAEASPAEAAAAESATTTPGMAAAAAAPPGEASPFGPPAGAGAPIPATMPSQPQVTPAAAPYTASPVKKKSKLPMVIGVLLVGFCLISSAVVGGAYWFLTTTADSIAAIGPEDFGGPSGFGLPEELPANPVVPDLAPATSDPVPAVAPVEPVLEAEPAAETEETVAPEPDPEPAAVVADAPPAGDDRGSEANDDRGNRRSDREARADREERPEPEERPEAAAPAGGNNLDSLRTQAREHWNAGNFAGAAAAYERAAAVAPRNAAVFMGLGSARYRMNDYRGAVAAYERAVELAPRNSAYLTSLGRALHRSGNTAGARQALQRALALDPNNRAARQGLEAMGN